MRAAAIGTRHRDGGLGWALIFLLVVIGSGCESAQPPVAYGDPLPGLSAAELERFRAGSELFNHVFSPAQGLGPLFNENQCSACHTDPAAGGTGEQFLVRAAHRDDAASTCDPLIGQGGDNVRQQATPALQAHGITKEATPAAATVTGRFVVPFLFGLGLAEAVAEATLLELADPDDADGNGISGRAGRDAEGRYARFGHKGEFVSIEAFVAGALLMEMGITSPIHPAEARGTADLPAEADLAADPEVDSTAVARLVDFVRFLAPPPRRVPPDAEARRVVDQGHQLFVRLGCADCHVPRLRTGRSDVRALDRRDVELFSDFLLHDMGPDLADVCGRDASPSELRTTPLAGLGSRRMFLHDGRALGLEDAIRAHGGEATAARVAFDSLSPILQDALIRFLRTL